MRIFSLNFRLLENKSTSFKHNTLESFIDWFIQNDGETHNYYSNNFSENRDRLKTELEKYEVLYENDFGSKVFSFANSNLNQHIELLKSNLDLNEGSFFKYSESKSNHMPRAILGKNNYLKFLREEYSELKIIPQIVFDITSFEKLCSTAGLMFTKKLIVRFISSLLTKPFVILTGLSGSGKTKACPGFCSMDLRERGTIQDNTCGAPTGPTGSLCSDILMG